MFDILLSSVLLEMDIKELRTAIWSTNTNYSKTKEALHPSCCKNYISV